MEDLRKVFIPGLDFDIVDEYRGDGSAKVPTTQPDADEAARLSVGRSLRYTAAAGDTVSKLALKLLGSDTAANRDLIIQSNPSLKADPDQLTAGRTYWIPAPTTADGGT